MDWQHPRMRHLIPLATLLLPAALPAVDVEAPSPPAYLAIEFKAEWRMKSLSEVLDDVQKAIDRPIATSPAAKEILGQRKVVLLDVRAAPLKEALERLEATQEIRFSAEPLLLRVETAEDALARRRRPVDLDLVEYGLSIDIHNSPAPTIGLRETGGGAPLAMPDGANAGGDRSGTAEVAVEWLGRIVETGGMELRGRTALQVLATPEEEAALRAALADALALKVRRSSWRITWGVAKEGTAVPTGLVPSADAARMVQALDQRSSQVLHAMAGQRVHGGRLQERSYIADLDIVGNQQDPSVSVLRTGRMADLRPLPGASLALVSYRLDWADPLAMTETAVTQGSMVEPGSVTIAPKDGAASTQIQEPAAIPGSQVTLQQPAVWSWSPRGDAVLPHGSALVLCAEHPLGHAVIAIEEVR